MRLVRGTGPGGAGENLRADAVVFWQDPTYVPLGMYDQPTAFKNYMKDVPDGWPQFYTLKKDA